LGCRMGVFYSCNWQSPCVPRVQVHGFSLSTKLRSAPWGPGSTDYMFHY
jgi:hypothetical protein